MPHPCTMSLAMALLCLATMSTGCGGCRDDDRTTLLDIRGHIFYVPPEVDWSSRDCCEWDGVTCSSRTGRVTGLDLSIIRNVALGRINATMFLPLQELRNLSLSHLQIEGCTPDAGFEVWSNLRNLKILDLSGSTGSLESSILSLTKILSLRSLFLNGNHFTSNVTIQQLSIMKLHTLDISNNDIQGSLPTDLSHNKLSGQLPSCLHVMGSDDTLFDFHPDFGDFPILFNVIGLPIQEEFMTKNREDYYKGNILNYVTGLDFSSNHLKGSIHESIGSMKWLRALNFSDNYLDGSIPQSLSNLSDLESLDLSHNNLEGHIPSELVALQALEVFSVAHNNLSGPTPGTMGQFLTFDQSSYEGNPNLCGPPLLKSCFVASVPELEERGADDDRVGDIILFGCSAMFYMLGPEEEEAMLQAKEEAMLQAKEEARLKRIYKCLDDPKFLEKMRRRFKDDPRAEAFFQPQKRPDPQHGTPLADAQ
ncbi:LRR receptor-like serine/threonine-protein kinase GSO1 [Hordeum vulgare]|nr:LRR receptor-like serine/threonine-protein kinase GSO1 [Hordeum vulgare]